MWTKSKYNAIILGKSVVALNGLVSSAYIAMFIPSIFDKLSPTEQRTSLNDLGTITTSSSIAMSFALGITNILTLPNLDIASTVQTINANIVLHSIKLAVDVYHYKYYPNAYSKRVYYSSMAASGMLLLLSAASCYKLYSAFPRLQLATGKIPRKRRRRAQKGVQQDHTGVDGDVEDNDNEEKEAMGELVKKGLTWSAQFYTQGLHNLMFEIDDEDIGSVTKAHFTVSECTGTQFKVSQQIGSVVLEQCEGVQVELEKEVGSLDMVHCKKCTVFVKQRVPMINVENCEDPKLVLFNPAMMQQPKITSSKCTRFAIDVQEADNEESDWKTLMVPQQMQIQINPQNFTLNTKLLRL
mmetsp:Transcript_42304/g.68003  ORF Transcript_42304/g.68003 Transcript_42304/m.68003 type:complete len:354 (+) Transcript_42304:34-1095(+)